MPLVEIYDGEKQCTSFAIFSPRKMHRAHPQVTICITLLSLNSGRTEVGTRTWRQTDLLPVMPRPPPRMAETVFVFFNHLFIGHRAACGTSVPQPGIEHWKSGALTSGPPGKSHSRAQLCSETWVNLTDLRCSLFGNRSRWSKEP